MEIDFVPIVVVQVWRVLVWCASLALLGSVVIFLPRAWGSRHDEELMPRWTLDVYIAVGVFIAQGCLVQGLRWDQPLMLQGLPVTTFAIAWCVAGRINRARAGV